MTHKRIAFTALVLCLLIAVFVGCKQKTPEEQAAQEQPAQAPETTEQAKPAKVWTDDDFIEYWAQTTYLSEKYEKDPIKLGEELGKVHRKLGVEGDEDNWSDSYAKWLGDWQQKAAADPEKAGKEWQKLIERMEKRVAELKKEK